MKKCTVFAPATVANVGSGFDVLGFALCDVGDLVQVEESSKPGLVIEAIIGADNIPLDPAKNVCTVAAQALLNALDGKQKCGYKFTITKRVAAGSGLGSSASPLRRLLWQSMNYWTRLFLAMNLSLLL